MRLPRRLLVAAAVAWVVWHATTHTPPVHAQSSARSTGACSSSPHDSADWKHDCELGAGFVYKTLKFRDDYDGKVTATVVRNEPLLRNARGTVLVIHGFLDYVFHRHVAERLMKAGYNFYGLDLRKYGRSMDGAVHPNYCRSMQEYFPEIAAAIGFITAHDSNVLLYAHSTGALPALLYAKDIDTTGNIDRIVLNSPFLDFTQWASTTAIASGLSRLFPFMAWKEPVSRWYPRSLHKEYKGEWVFNRDWKPIDGAVAYLGWVRCVNDAQQRIKKGLRLDRPVLVMHSDKSSTHGSTWKPEYAYTDLILDVDDISKLSDRIGGRVTRVVIRGAVHDVVLSREPAREHAFEVMIDWIERPVP